jgi:hypothetical protein
VCMAPTHRLAGAWSGALYGWHVGLPWWACVGTAAAATVTSAGILSPDADQYRGWRRVDKYTPDELLGHGGPLQHRGLTHFWGLPLAAAYGMHSATLPAVLTLIFWALIVGWVSHLVLDFAVGAKGWGRNAGIPLAPWWWHVGLGFKAGGVVEMLLGTGMCLTAAAVAWQAVTS